MPRSLNSASVGVDPCRWTAASALRGGGRVGQPSAIFHDDRSATAAKQPGQPARLTSPLLLSNGHGLVVDWGRCPPLRAASSALVFRLGRGPASAASLARTGFMSERAQRPVVVVTRLRRRPARAERDPGLIACRRSGRNRKADVMPPSSGKAAPVMKPASSLARYATVPASSSSVPKRPIG